MTKQTVGLENDVEAETYSFVFLHSAIGGIFTVIQRYRKYKHVHMSSLNNIWCLTGANAVWTSSQISRVSYKIKFQN